MQGFAHGEPPLRPGLDGRAVQHIAIYAVKVELQARLVEHRGNKAMLPGAVQRPDGLVILAAGVLLELRGMGHRDGQGGRRKGRLVEARKPTAKSSQSSRNSGNQFTSGCTS
jgi:hypothetical protein